MFTSSSGFARRRALRQAESPRAPLAPFSTRRSGRPLRRGRPGYELRRRGRHRGGDHRLDLRQRRQPDGKLVVVGLSLGTGSRTATVARFNTDGSLDRSFGGGTASPTSSCRAWTTVSSPRSPCCPTARSSRPAMGSPGSIPTARSTARSAAATASTTCPSAGPTACPSTAWRCDGREDPPQHIPQPGPRRLGPPAQRRRHPRHLLRRRRLRPAAGARRRPVHPPQRPRPRTQRQDRRLRRRGRLAPQRRRHHGRHLRRRRRRDRRPGDLGSHNAVLQPDGKIVLAGSVANDSFDGGWAVARLNSDGSPDRTFGLDGDGVARTPFNDLFPSRAGATFDLALNRTARSSPPATSSKASPPSTPSSPSPATTPTARPTPASPATGVINEVPGVASARAASRSSWTGAAASSSTATATPPPSAFPPSRSCSPTRGRPR